MLVYPALAAGKAEIGSIRGLKSTKSHSHKPGCQRHPLCADSFMSDRSLVDMLPLGSEAEGNKPPSTGILLTYPVTSTCRSRPLTLVCSFVERIIHTGALWIGWRGTRLPNLS